MKQLWADMQLRLVNHFQRDTSSSVKILRSRDLES